MQLEFFWPFRLNGFFVLYEITINNVVVIIIVPPLPFVSAILVIDDILLFCYLNKWHCLHVVCALLRSSSSSSSSSCCCCFNDCSAFAVRESNV